MLIYVPTTFLFFFHSFCFSFCLLPFFSSNISLISFSDITLCPLFPFLLYFFASSHHIYFLLFPSFLTLFIFFLLHSFFPELSSFSSKLFFFSTAPIVYFPHYLYFHFPSFLSPITFLNLVFPLLKFFLKFSNFCHTYNLSSYNLNFLSLCVISFSSSFLVYFNVFALSCLSFLNLFQSLNSFLFFFPLYIILVFIFIP